MILSMVYLLFYALCGLCISLCLVEGNGLKRAWLGLFPSLCNYTFVSDQLFL